MNNLELNKKAEGSATLSLSAIVAPLKRGHSFSANAWLLSYAPGAYVALPLQSCQEVLENPEILAVPGIARYSLGLLQWRNLWIPLFDLNSLVSGGVSQKSHFSYCQIVAYKDSDNRISYAALSLTDFPQVGSVSDDDICALPDSDYDWKKIAVSCFYHLDSRVPIVNANKLFSSRHQ